MKRFTRTPNFSPPSSAYVRLRIDQLLTMAPSIDAKAVALIAAGSAAVTYLIAKRQFESKIVTERRKVRANKI